MYINCIKRIIQKYTILLSIETFTQKTSVFLVCSFFIAFLVYSFSTLTDAPLITQSMTGKYIKTEGAALNLSCDVLSNPTADINWTFNSSAINDSTNGYNVSLSTNTQINRVVSNTTLFIGNLRRTMQGYYACNAKNPQGSVQRVTTVIVHCEYNSNLALSLLPYFEKDISTVR